MGVPTLVRVPDGCGSLLSGDLQIQACVGAAPPSTAWGSYGAYAAPRPSQTGDRRSVSSAFPAALTLDLTRAQS